MIRITPNGPGPLLPLAAGEELAPRLRLPQPGIPALCEAEYAPFAEASFPRGCHLRDAQRLELLVHGSDAEYAGIKHVLRLRSGEEHVARELLKLVTLLPPARAARAAEVLQGSSNEAVMSSARRMLERALFLPHAAPDALPLVFKASRDAWAARLLADYLGRGEAHFSPRFLCNTAGSLASNPFEAAASALESALLTPRVNFGFSLAVAEALQTRLSPECRLRLHAYISGSHWDTAALVAGATISGGVGRLVFSALHWCFSEEISFVRILSALALLRAHPDKAEEVLRQETSDWQERLQGGEISIGLKKEAALRLLEKRVIDLQAGIVISKERRQNRRD